MKVAVIGLGAMGSRMAKRLVEAGHEVVVWNRTASKVKPLAEAGAAIASGPAEAARGAEAVLTMVSDPAALADVTEGPAGVMAGLETSAALVQMATVGTAALTRLASTLPAGRDLLDAPVLGSITEAEAGSLRIFAGGAAEVVERCMPVLSALGEPLHVGPLGAGQAAKLVANTTLLGVLALLGETLALADRSGLPRDVAFEVLASTPLAAQAERRRPVIEGADGPVRFALSLARKDADLILEAAADLRLGAAARSWLADAEAAGAGDLDYSAVIRHIIGG